MEPEWEKFLFLVCEDQESISSPAYQLIIEHFPVQFVRKLMATIQHGSTWETRHQATMLLDYLFHDIVEENYGTMERGCIEEMERSAMNLLMVEDDAYVLDKVKGVVKTLLGLSIDHNRVWKDFIKVAGKSFIARQASRLKELTVDIFLDLSIDHQDYVCRELVPDFLHLHTKKLVEKFADSEEDQTAFSILWVVCNMVPIDQLEVLMEAATKAPLFWGGKRVSAAKKCLAGLTLCYCIRHRNLRFSTQMSHKLQNIICLMLKSEEVDVRSIGVQLGAAFGADLLLSCLQKKMFAFW